MDNPKVFNYPVFSQEILITPTREFSKIRVEDLDNEVYWPYIRFSSLNQFSLRFGEAAGVFQKAWDGVLQYGYDGESWTTITPPQSGTGLVIGSRQNDSGKYVLYMRGENNTTITYDSDRDLLYPFGFSGNSAVECDGNLISLLSYTAVQNKTQPEMAPLAFRQFFINFGAKLTKAPLMPFTTTSEGCFMEMFKNTGIVAAPNLPATELAESCYEAMFSGCTSLVSAPNLPATVLKVRCYSNMFYGCSGLRNPPKLGAGKLVSPASFSCQQMFKNCNVLQSAPEVKFSIGGQNCTRCFEETFRACNSLNNIDLFQIKEFSESQLVDCSYLFNYTFGECFSLKTILNLPYERSHEGMCYKMYFQSGVQTTPETYLGGSGDYQFYQAFAFCTSLQKQPIRPGSSVGISGFEGAYLICSSLNTIGGIACMNIGASAFAQMYGACASLKFSQIRSEECFNEFIITAPSSGTAYQDMITGTSGDLQQISGPGTYYTNAQIYY